METKEVNGGIRIIVLQRGWVIVGHYYRSGDDCRVENCAVIRRWGTTNGLPQLAQEGPLAETKLEKTSFPARFHRAAEVLTFDCNESNWIFKLC